MNNWSRAFYHYIATCCLYGDEEYDKAAIDFVQIPRLLARRRKSGTRLLANEQFAERTILQWIRQAATIVAENNNTDRDDDEDWRHRVMDGHLLQQVVVVNPLWELIYLWNGIYYVSPTMLRQMKQGLQQAIDRMDSNNDALSCCSEVGRLQLFLGVVERELGNVTIAETCFRRVIALEKTCLLEHHHYDALDTDDPIVYKTSWAGAYALYEMALLKCLPAPSSAEPQAKKIKEAREWLRRVDQFHQQHHHHHSGNATAKSGSNGGASSSMVDVSCESACMLLHIRCQLLYEKLDELLDD
jgi:tetratricopeptide (TPR) repeat protein